MIKKTVLIIPYIDLPQNLQNNIRENDNFGNDKYLQFCSELEPYEHETWEGNLTVEAIQNYYQDQVEINAFNGSFNQFVTSYGLELEMWLIEQEVDLSGVEDIFIKVCW